jgi:hypothetical protein
VSQKRITAPAPSEAKGLLVGEDSSECFESQGVKMPVIVTLSTLEVSEPLYLVHFAV